MFGCKMRVGKEMDGFHMSVLSWVQARSLVSQKNGAPAHNWEWLRHTVDLCYAEAVTDPESPDTSDHLDGLGNKVRPSHRCAASLCWLVGCRV